MDGSRTMTLVATPGTNSFTTETSTTVLERSFRVLTVTSRRRVTWQEGTIDNEGMCKKSSKRCCIYTKRRQYDDESSDEDDDTAKPMTHGNPANPRPSESPGRK